MLALGWVVAPALSAQVLSPAGILFENMRVFDGTADRSKMVRRYSPVVVLKMATANNAELLALSGPRSAPLWRRCRAARRGVRQFLRRCGFACTLCAASDGSFRPVGVVSYLIEWCSRTFATGMLSVRH
jgi:hypothetical protein